MTKFLVETYYTCTFKIVHELGELNEKELSDIEKKKIRLSQSKTLVLRSFGLFQSNHSIYQTILDQLDR